MKKLLLFSLFYSGIAFAHPHAFIEMQTKVLVEENQLVGFSMNWMLDEASSSAVLYDMKQARGEGEKQKLVDDVMDNVVNEHYFSYFFNKHNNKIKYKKQVKNYGVSVKGRRIQYYFDFFLSQPQSLQDNAFTLMTYDRTYYVSMYYPEDQSAVDFSALPKNCKGSLDAPNVDEKIQSYAASLDKTQKDEDDSLGVMFAQKIKIQCE
ncbi:MULTISPECIES: zinc transporter binding subunit ZevA [unclassified Pasteurella]|uniref:zinc transporter binding subunit ZevA n=1 Tax=unclassified Pasteurella TaxID=2621516 RepID=UPI001073A361|nr:zinc transporter binding subunit ZevA [Pasteurella sp. 19428wF3_WM03]TFU52517.1 zinc transporter binding subunit ZevA [Pasteurella sp. WM03]